jgi:hypothetical protein
LLISTVIATTCACEFGKEKYRVFLSSCTWAQPHTKLQCSRTW